MWFLYHKTSRVTCMPIGGSPNANACKAKSSTIQLFYRFLGVHTLYYHVTSGLYPWPCCTSFLILLVHCCLLLLTFYYSTVSFPVHQPVRYCLLVMLSTLWSHITLPNRVCFLLHIRTLLVFSLEAFFPINVMIFHDYFYLFKKCVIVIFASSIAEHWIIFLELQS